MKPEAKDEFVEGIKTFWGKVDKEKCSKHISHLRKVIPKVVELQGAACYWILRLSVLQRIL